MRSTFNSPSARRTLEHVVRRSKSHCKRSVKFSINQDAVVGSRAHIAPIVAARSVVVLWSAGPVADLQPVAGAVGEVGDRVRVKAGRVLTGETGEGERVLSAVEVQVVGDAGSTRVLRVQA